MNNLCKDCEKTAKCYFEINKLVCKKIWDHQKELDKKEKEIAKLTAKAFWG
jgi:hypothetical protein